jgi:Insertion element 4 transposase N-terminal
MVCYVLALALFQQDSYDDVAENLVGALEGMDEAIPNKSSFTRARQRLGAGVIEGVFRRLAGPVAPAGLDGAFCRGMRVAAVSSSPWIRWYPQPWFSVASRSIKAAIRVLTGGRPVRFG